MINLIAALNPVALSFGGLEIRWYGVIIAIGILIAMTLATKEAENKGLDPDFIVDMMFWTIPLGIIGARIYYVLFELDYYLQNPGEIIQIWNGGIAIYGALIAGILTIYWYTKRKGISFALTMDILAPAVLIAQSIGRWGNFMNQEAHGEEVSRAFLENLFLPKFIIEQMNINGIYYHPTFLYESLWSLTGFVLILFLRRKGQLLRVGEVMFTYVMWYSFGRFFIEGMRTDSLYLFGPIRVSQALSILLFLGAMGVWAYRRRNNYPPDPYYADITRKGA
ncbi:prolipoprotein diacylglyceryl transferase [Trichococcus sp.]|uniref:prolipoprotein diacylglyceryl transferase n=1 Tax=Trichococcus sp. TaxID=1985464 RepID=UPI003C7D2C43